MFWSRISRKALNLSQRQNMTNKIDQIELAFKQLFVHYLIRIQIKFRNQENQILSPFISGVKISLAQFY